MIKLLPGLFAFFFLTTVIYAAATSIGFDKPEYLIPPGHNQQIYAQLRDAAGQVVKAENTTYVYIYPGSTSARVSSAISTPSFSATAKLTIAKGTTQRSFLYLDSSMGTSTLIATSSGYPNGSLKITIGFPPPPPPPTPLANVTAQPIAPIVLAPTPVTQAPVTASEIVTAAPAEIQPPAFVVTAETPPHTQTQAPQVLAASSAVKVDNSFSFLTQLLSWFTRLLSDNIGL